MFSVCGDKNFVGGQASVNFFATVAPKCFNLRREIFVGGQASVDFFASVAAKCSVSAAIKILSADKAFVEFFCRALDEPFFFFIMH